MSIGVSPRLFATSFTSFVGLMTETLVEPSVGAVLFTYFATDSLLTSQSDPWGARNAPAALSYETSSCALICVGSVPLPFVTARSFATKTAFALNAVTVLSTMISFFPTIGMSAAPAIPAPKTTQTATVSAPISLTDVSPPTTTGHPSGNPYRTRILYVKGNWQILWTFPGLARPPPADGDRSKGV